MNHGQGSQGKEGLANNGNKNTTVHQGLRQEEPYRVSLDEPCAYNECRLPPWVERELRHKPADPGMLIRPSKQKGYLAQMCGRGTIGLGGAAVVWDTTPKPHPKTASESRLQAQ
jgi:hypothetical protein